MVHLFYNHMVIFCLNQARCRDSSSVAVALITKRCCKSCWPTNGCLPHPISGPGRERRKHGSLWRSPGRLSRCYAARQSAGRPPQRPVLAPLSSRPRDGVWQAPVRGPAAFAAPFRDERNSNRATVSAARLIETKDHHVIIEQMYHKNRIKFLTY